MRLRLALSALAAVFASLCVAQDTIQLVHGPVFTGEIAELDFRYLTIRQDGGRGEVKLFPRDSVSLVRYNDGRIYAFTRGRPTRVARQEITPLKDLRLEKRFFGDRFYDGSLRIPHEALDYKLLSVPQDQRQLFYKGQGLRTVAKGLTIPTFLMVGLTTFTVFNPNLTIRPGFAIATVVVGALTIAINADGNGKQRRAVEAINSGR